MIKTVFLLLNQGFFPIADAESEVLWRADVTDLRSLRIHKGDRLK